MTLPQGPLGGHELVTIPQLPAALRARRWLIVLCVLLGLGLGAVLAATFSTQYTAMATVRLGAGFTAAGAVTNDNAPASTEAQVAVLRPQIEEIAREIDTPANVVADELSVANRPGTSLVDFTYSAPSVEEAENGARVATKVYLDQALQSARDKIDAREALLRQEATVAPPENQSAIAAELRALELTVVDAGSVVRDSAGSAERSLLMPVTYLVVGAVGGLILGCFLALLVEVVRPRVRRNAPLGGIRLLGRLADDTGPHEAASLLTPAIVTAGGDLRLVPLGTRADAVAELLARTVDGIRAVATIRTDGIEQAASRSAVVLVREGERVPALRALLDRLELVGATVIGMITVSPRACDNAESVLDAEYGAHPAPSAAADNQDEDDRDDQADPADQGDASAVDPGPAAGDDAAGRRDSGSSRRDRREEPEIVETSLDSMLSRGGFSTW